MEKFAVGVDLGGTTVKTGLVSANGKIIAQAKVPTLGEQGPKAVLGQIVKSIETVIAGLPKRSLIGIGIGAPGIISKKGGVVRDPPNFSRWHHFALGGEVQKKFRVRTEVENDANVAAIAESKFGVGKKYPNFLFVIWGTGVGGGIILNGEIFRGPQGGAGEVGHQSIDYNGLPCNCGAKGCVEAYIGQRYLSQRTVEVLRQHPESKIVELVGGDLSKVEPLYISQAAHAGDVIARDILIEAGTLLGVAIGAVMNVCDLRVSIIGGGQSAAGQFVLDAIKKSVKAHVLKPLRKDIKVLQAKLGNDAGILGAAGLVM